MRALAGIQDRHTGRIFYFLFIQIYFSYELPEKKIEKNLLFINFLKGFIAMKFKWNFNERY